MKIEGLHVDGFGIWTGLALGGVNAGLNVFYGPNEAGKSTLLQFIRGVFYGFSPERRRYFPPAHGGRPGGWLQVTGAQGSFQVGRYADPSGGPRGELALTAADGTRHGDHFLKVLLAEVDEPIFQNVFAVGLQELQELATLGDTEAAEQLYSLSAGLDRVSLVDVVKALDASRGGILSPRGEPCQVTNLVAQREKLRGEIEELEELTRHYGRLMAERQQLDRDVERLTAEKQRIQQQLRTVEIAAKLRDPWGRRQELDHQLAGLGPAARLPEGAMTRLERLSAGLRRHQQRLEELQGQEKPLRTDLGVLRINENLWRQAARIQALREQQGWLKGLQDQAAGVAQEVAALQSQLNGEYQQLGLPAPNGAANKPGGDVVASRRIAGLRPIAHAVQQAKRRWAEAQQQADAAQEVVRTLQQQIDASLGTQGEKDLTTAMDRTSAQVTQLRRRLAVDDKLDQLTQYQEELDSQRQDALGGQMLPTWMVVLQGFMFMFGAALLMLGMIVTWWVVGLMGWILTLLGLGGMALTWLVRFAVDRSNNQDLDETEKQLDALRTQLRQAKEERETLDKQIPRGGGPLASRLEKTEKQLASLEDLVPLDARRKSAVQEAETARHQAEKAKNELLAARRRWREALQAARLPENFSLRQVRQWSKQSDHLGQLQRRLSLREEELKQHRNQYEGLAGRISQMLVDCGLETKEHDPQRQLQLLVDSLAEQESRFKRRDELRHGLGQVRHRQKRHQEKVRRLKSRRRQILREAGLHSEEELRHVARTQSQVDALRKERETVHREITAAIGNHCSEAAIGEHLQNSLRLETMRTELLEALAAVEAQLPDRFERRGRLVEQLGNLAGDGRLPDRRLELSAVEKRLEETIGRWQVQAVTNRVLDAIRISYEQERQPEALQEASRYLARLTQNHYSRVWTPLGQRTLHVDDDQGRAWPVEQLSRGAREQLFLALRMSLVSAYGRQGKVLPMILDDVLVNFDTERAHAAAALLTDFAAEGHQVLVFTCHEHVFQMFQGDDVSCHRLPVHGRPAPVAVFAPPPKREPKPEPEPEPRPEPKRRRRRKPEPLEEEPVIEHPVPKEDPEEIIEPVHGNGHAIEEPLIEDEWEEDIAEAAPEEELEVGLWEEPSDQDAVFAEDDEV